MWINIYPPNFNISLTLFSEQDTSTHAMTTSPCRAVMNVVTVVKPALADVKKRMFHELLTFQQNYEQFTHFNGLF